MGGRDSRILKAVASRISRQGDMPIRVHRNTIKVLFRLLGLRWELGQDDFREIDALALDALRHLAGKELQPMTQTPPNDVAGLVARLRELLAKAEYTSPLPWRYVRSGSFDTVECDDGNVASFETDDDANLAVEAVNALPMLLAALSTPAPVAQEGECNCAARFYGDDLGAHQLSCAALAPPSAAPVGDLREASETKPRGVGEETGELQMLAYLLDGYARDRSRERLPETARVLSDAAKWLRAYDAALQQSKSTPGALPVYRCHHCKRLVAIPDWDEQCPHCHCRAFSQIAASPVPVDAGGGLLHPATVEACAKLAADFYRGHGKAFRTPRAYAYEHAGRSIAAAIRRQTTPGTAAPPPQGEGDR